MSRSLCSLAAILGAALALPKTALAGNDDGVLLGNDAAMLGGAITAAVSDGSALWYNPAGLGHARDFATVDVSASAFVLRSYRMPHLISATDGSSADASFIELVSIPSAVTAVRPLSARITGALGLFTPQVNDYTLRASLTTQQDVVTRWQIALTNRESQYQAGAGLAFSLSPRVMFGVALFGSYYSSSSSLQVSGGVEDSNGSVYGFAVQSGLTSDTLLGVLVNLGLTVRVVDNLHLGVGLRSPGMSVFRSRHVTSVDAVTSLDEDGAPVGGFEPQDERTRRATVALLSPLRARLGLAYFFPNGGVIDIDGDVQPQMLTRSLDIDRKLVWNMRVGARFPLGENYAAGIGAFTDRSPDKALPDGTGPLDFYGFSAGLQYWSARNLADAEPQTRITFSTTLGIRYARGQGKLQGTRIDAETGDVSAPARPISVDEYTLHLGSALYF